jgi:TPR repeat protein
MYYLRNQINYFKTFNSIILIMKKNDIDPIYKLARKGDKEAQYELGMNYRYCWIRNQQDFNKAFCWFKKSANQNYNKAQYELGELYYYGYGIKSNIKQAIYW